MVNLLYPRIISVRRQNSTVQVGQGAFGGDTPVNETVVLTNIPANISYERVGRANQANLPTDARRSTWLIVLPAINSVLGSILEDDVVVDDLGKRYQLYASDWTILGYSLHGELLIT